MKFRKVVQSHASPYLSSCCSVKVNRKGHNEAEDGLVDVGDEGHVVSVLIPELTAAYAHTLPLVEANCALD